MRSYSDVILVAMALSASSLLVVKSVSRPMESFCDMATTPKAAAARASIAERRASSPRRAFSSIAFLPWRLAP
jgi:hypothetical protein